MAEYTVIGMSTDAEQLDAARAVKDKVAKIMESFGHVLGVGITRRDGVYAVKVNLENKPDASEAMPQQIDGVPILIRVVGRIHKQND